MTRAKRRSRDRKPRRPPWARKVDESTARPERSPTAVAAEALRTGVLPRAARRRPDEIPREDETIRVGDPDDDTLANEYVGDETPGGTASTPDQSNVDDIGRAYGLQEEDTGALRSAEEVLARRDRRRSELRPPGKPPG